MNCKKCGYELKENWNICPRCSEVIENKNMVVDMRDIQQVEKVKLEENQNLQQNDGKDKIYLSVFLVSITCGIFIEQISGIGFLVALISIVAGFIKYPNNRAIKVLFWLFLAGVVLYIMFIILVMFMCASAMSSFSC